MKIRNALLAGVGFAAAAGLTAAAALKVYRDRIKAENAIDETKGIHLTAKPVIGGIRQYIQIRGENRENPVLLFIHGGPGNPVSSYCHIYQREWEKFFTVVNWDQRCCGLSETCEGELDQEMFIEDTREVAEYIGTVLPGKPIVIFGQSWGSVVGSLAAHKYPWHFAAYIGTGQVVDSGANFEVAFRHAVECAQQEGNTELYEALLAAEEKEGDHKFLSAPYYKARARYGFASAKYRDPKELQKVMHKASLFSPNMSVADGARMLHSSLDVAPQYIVLINSDIFLKFRLEEITTEYQIPYYNINGDNDWQTPYVLAKEYFEKVEAPIKKWYSLDNCGHMVQFDAPEQLTSCLREIRYELFPEN